MKPVLLRSIRHLAGTALAALLAGPMAPAVGAAPPDPAPRLAPVPSRSERPPRKVVVGTVVCGYGINSWSLDRRLNWMDETVDAMQARARRMDPGRRLDLVVLPEYFLARPGDALEQTTVRLNEVESRIAACASRHGCYLVVPMLLRETDRAGHFSNAAVLVDRAGRVVGIYRKVHPVAPQGSDVLEGGVEPGHEFPVFTCDFGRLGIQICFDMLYRDGWQALADQGAEIVALPSASPETVRPALYAFEHQFYIVSASPRDHAAVFDPRGVIQAEATRTGEVLVRQIDLSFAILHWEAALDEGRALRRRYGDHVGFLYERPQDMGIFWSNDPTTPIGRMVAALGLIDSDANVERVRRLQDQARGGPPSLPSTPWRTPSR